MRIVFTAYAINAAVVSLLLTTALMICDEFSETFERIVNLVVMFMYVSFGPALLTCCLFGMTDIKSLSQLCIPGGLHHVNTVDPAILMLATILSLFVTFCFGLKITNSMAEEELNNEGSVFF